jgi:tetratricopeptide (TPR) repeat protein
MERDPDFGRAQMIIYAYVEKGLYKDAITDVQQWDRKFGQNLWSLAITATIYGRQGDKARASAAVHRIEELSRNKPIDPAVLLTAYLGEGDKERALQWLAKAYEAHATSLTNLKVNPEFDSLRQEPRFHAVLRGMNLE